MKNNLPLIIAGALTALFALNTRADDTQTPPAPKHARGSESHGHRPPGPNILAQYDADKDGKLSDTELAALKADIDSGKVTVPTGKHDEDHGRPVEAIAKELGVTPEQFRAAFKLVHPAGKGEQPTEEQRVANRTALAAALGVAPEKLDEVMDKYRPEGKVGHRPGGRGEGRPEGKPEGKHAGGPGGVGGHGHHPSPEVLAKYDVNQDGKLDETERAALKADIASGAFVPPARPQHPQDGAEAPAPAPAQ